MENKTMKKKCHHKYCRHEPKLKATIFNPENGAVVVDYFCSAHKSDTTELVEMCKEQGWEFTKEEIRETKP